jgi:26S proteasome regulatory subunit T2
MGLRLRQGFSINRLPDIKTKRYIFKIHTSRMSLADDVDLEEFVQAKDELSGADIKAVCTEAGLLALRERRMRVTMADLRAAREKTMFAKKDNGPEGLCTSLRPLRFSELERYR